MDKEPLLDIESQERTTKTTIKGWQYYIPTIGCMVVLLLIILFLALHFGGFM